MQHSKLTVKDRILCAVSGLVLMAAAVCAAIAMIGIKPFASCLAPVMFELPIWQKAVIWAVCAVLFLLGFHTMRLIKTPKEKGIVVQHTEYGDMNISMNAIRTMVSKVVSSQNDISAETTDVRHSRSGIAIDLKISVPSGTNIPLTVNNLQKQVKQYISNCSGIEVEEVKVLVETEASKAVTPVSVPVFTNDEPAAKTADNDKPVTQTDALSEEVPAVETVTDKNPEEAAEEE